MVRLYFMCLNIPSDSYISSEVLQYLCLLNFRCPFDVALSEDFVSYECDVIQELDILYVYVCSLNHEFHVIKWIYFICVIIFIVKKMGYWHSTTPWFSNICTFMKVTF